MKQKLTSVVSQGRAWVANQSMRTKLIAGIAIVSSFVLILSLIVSSVFETKHFRSRIVESYQMTARLMAVNLQVAVSFEDEKDAHDILESLSAYPSIRFACVQLPDGRHLAHYVVEDASEDLAIPMVPEVEIHGMNLSVTEPIFSDNESIGAIYIEGRMDEYAKYLGFKLVLLVIILSVSIFLMFFLATWIGNRATQPILNLAATARKITNEGDFSLRQKVTSSDEIGELIRSFNQMMDDIESKNQIIQASERRFRSYFELGIVGMALLDSKLEFCESNARLQQIFGCESQSVCAGGMMDRIAAESDTVADALREVAAGKLDRFTGECWLETCDSRNTFALVSLCRIQEYSIPGQPCIILLLQDITDRKQYEDALLAEKERAEASNRAKDEFLSIISHELRTPLNPIIGYAELLELELESAEHLQQLEYIKESGNHLLNIINTILDYTRFDRGLGNVTLSTINYRSVCDECLSVFKNTAGAKPVVFTSEHEVAEALNVAETFIIQTDKTKFKQVVLNLLSNASKFTDQGFIRLKTSLIPVSDGEYKLTVRVEDSGIGIEPEKQEMIFEPFLQGDLSLSRKYEGLGLGLSICRKIAQLLGGSIHCTSEVGVGSCFVFEIPVVIVSNPASGEKHSETSEHANSSKRNSRSSDRVLVIDDDYLNRKIATSMLTRMGYEVDVAEDGENGVEMALKYPYKAILMDIQMPRMNGYEASQRIRSDSGLKATPIIAVTAHSMNFETSKGPSSGMDGYIGKPYSFQQLHDKLSELCY